MEAREWLDCCLAANCLQRKKTNAVRMPVCVYFSIFTPLPLPASLSRLMHAHRPSELARGSLFALVVGRFVAFYGYIAGTAIFPVLVL